ncbi:tetratricopeptide repeat protein [Tumidithrix elongata RA019]|uniref:Tetratricopeptide repeat protein n=1 Tax=Tumidithrix elongata BACA0141 TaxID=2716417 RepID=A0AAW9Q5D9_9CYAN|nr:tetratricopeptide repeat protein [Tumidithrix elongata RA019]
MEGYQTEHYLIINDTKGEHKVPLSAAYYSLGRSPDCDIVLHSSLVSRQHATLLYLPVKPPLLKLFRIVDGNMEGLRSTNGIQINGKAYTSYVLVHGDEIVFSSNTKAYYCIEPEPPYKKGDYTEIIATLTDLAKSYNSQNRFSEAEEFLLQVIDIKRQANIEVTLDVAESLIDLAAIYYSQQRFNESETIFLEAIEIKRKQLGNDHLDVATSLIDLAAIYNSQNRFMDAEVVFLEALKIKQKSLGADHPDIAASLVDLAAIYYAQNRYPDIIKSYKQALKIYKQRFGDNHANTIEVRKKLANIQNKNYPKWLSLNTVIAASLLILSGAILYSIFAQNQSNLLCVKTIDGKEQTFRGAECQNLTK